jgi:nitroreductase
MIAPGPSPQELQDILEIAVRTPDHGKLAPWRFVVIPAEARADFHALIDRAFREDNPAPSRGELEANERFALQAPCLVVALSAPVVPSKIPLWEQQLSCGAAIMNLSLAAHAHGYTAGWITGWAAYSETVLRAFGNEGERIAGFVYVGTPAFALEERPRPPLEQVVSTWSGA